MADLEQDKDGETVVDGLSLSNESITSLGAGAAILGSISGLLTQIAGNPLLAGAGAVKGYEMIKKLGNEMFNLGAKAKTTKKELEDASKATEKSKDGTVKVTKEVESYQKMLKQLNSTFSVSTDYLTKHTGVPESTTIATEESTLATTKATEAFTAAGSKANVWIFVGATILALINKYQQLRKELALTGTQFIGYTHGTTEATKLGTNVTLQQLDVQMKYGEDIAKTFNDTRKEVGLLAEKEFPHNLGAQLALYTNIAATSIAKQGDFAKGTREIFELFSQYGTNSTHAFSALKSISDAFDAQKTPLGTLNDNLSLGIELLDKYKKEGYTLTDSLVRTTIAMEKFSKAGLTVQQTKELLQGSEILGEFGEKGINARLNLAMATQISGGLDKTLIGLLNKNKIKYNPKMLAPALEQLALLDEPGLQRWRQDIARRVTRFGKFKEESDFRKSLNQGQEFKYGTVEEYLGMSHDLANRVAQMPDIGEKGIDKKLLEDGQKQLDDINDKTTQDLATFDEAINTTARDLKTWQSSLIAFAKEMGIHAVTQDVSGTNTTNWDLFGFLHPAMYPAMPNNISIPNVSSSQQTNTNTPTPSQPVIIHLNVDKGLVDTWMIDILNQNKSTTPLTQQ